MQLLNREKKRFWARVTKTTICWHWRGCFTGNNRGSFYVNGKRYLPTEVMLALQGEFRKEGLMILHTCDNKLCVNPEHLYWGTQFDNMKDRSERHSGWKWSEETRLAFNTRKEAHRATLRLSV